MGFVTGPTYGRRRVARQNGSGRQRRQSVRSLLLHLLLHLLLNLLLLLHLLLLLTVDGGGMSGGVSRSGCSGQLLLQ